MSDALAQRAAATVAAVAEQHAGAPKSELWPRVLDQVQTMGLEHDEELALAQACYECLFGLGLG